MNAKIILHKFSIYIYHECNRLGMILKTHNKLGEVVFRIEYRGSYQKLSYLRNLHTYIQLGGKKTERCIKDSSMQRAWFRFNTSYRSTTSWINVSLCGHNITVGISQHHSRYILFSYLWSSGRRYPTLLCSYYTLIWLACATSQVGPRFSPTRLSRQLVPLLCIISTHAYLNALHQAVKNTTPYLILLIIKDTNYSI